MTLPFGDNGNVVVFFEGVDDDTVGDAYPIISDKRGHYLYCAGNLDGGTVDIQMQIDTYDWVTVEGSEFTGPGVKFLEGMGNGVKLRGRLTGTAAAANATLIMTK